MTLFQVIRSLQTIALANPYIENVGDGSIYDFMNANPSIKYGVFFVSQTTHREDDYFDWFGFNLFVIDRLVDNLESNRLEIQSIAKEVLSNTIKTFVKKFLGVTHGEIRYTPFTQRFADLCAGQYCNIEFKIPKAIICEENFKEIEIIHDDCAGVYENGYRKGYEDGLNNCPECPDCPECSGYTQEDLDKAYDDGFESGHTSGVTEQKSLLTDITVTQNGLTYTNPDGFSAVTVDVPEKTLTNLGFRIKNNGKRTYIAQEYGADGFETIEITVDVPQTGHTDQEITDAYNSGVTEGVSQQKAKLIPTAITENGSYVREDGYSAITVNVPQTGYTQQDLDNAYNSGHTSGVTEQKALLSSTTITQNGTYTRENGWSAVTVNVSGYTQEDLDNAYQRGWNDGYQSGYTDGSTPVDYTKIPVSFKITSGGTLNWRNTTTGTPRTIQYKINNGEWTSITSSTGGTPIQVVSGDTIQFRGDNITYGENTGNYCHFYRCTAQFEVKGNIMSLIDSQNYTNLTTLSSAYTFYYFFTSCTGLTDASNLILPATTLTTNCYGNMFNNCRNMTSAPVLPATTLADYCYSYMFVDCTSLTTAPQLPATILTPYCYTAMFYGCTSLTTAPELPATNLVNRCYMYMFKGCTKLNYIKCLATDISASSCTNEWVSGVASTGTFVKKAGVNWQTGISGIPNGWTVVEE